MNYYRIIFRKALVGLPIGITIIDRVGYVARVDGQSMQPVLNPEGVTDYVFLSVWSIRHSNIARGDVISFISPKNPNHKIIKRVIGVPGDVIDPLKSDEAVKIPDHHCWVEGDHRAHSMDSNNFGPISYGLVTGKATAIVWPPARWQIIEPVLQNERLPINYYRLK